jgi:hypothetical protein
MMPKTPEFEVGPGEKTYPMELPNGSFHVATLPPGTVLRRHPSGDGFIAAHPDHNPLWIRHDGTTETISAK